MIKMQTFIQLLWRDCADPPGTKLIEKHKSSSGLSVDKQGTLDQLFPLFAGGYGTPGTVFMASF